VPRPSIEAVPRIGWTRPLDMMKIAPAIGVGKEGMKTVRAAAGVRYHVTRFGDHPLSILARAFHAHGFIGSEQGARYFVR
jgi:hypothetical protein